MKKKKTVKVQEKSHVSILDDDLVLSYLKDNPNFFMRNASRVDEIKVPHGIHGTVSLVEWQLKRQRERIGQLEEEITSLFETAYQNENIFNQLLDLIVSLSLAEDLSDFSNRLSSWTRKIGLSHVEIRLFTNTWNVAPPFEKTEWGIEREKFESVRINKLSNSKHFLGMLNPTELNLILTQSVLVGSVALSLLDYPCIDNTKYNHDISYNPHKLNKPNTQSIKALESTHSKPYSSHFAGIGEKNVYSGMILFISPNESHFQKGLDTALLDKLTKFIPIFLNKWIALR